MLVADLEASKSISSTPRSTRTQPQTVLTASFSLNSQQLLQADQGLSALSQPLSQTAAPPNLNTVANSTQLFTQGTAVNNTQDQTQHVRLSTSSAKQIQAAFNSDGGIPSLNALRQNNTISQSVNQVTTSYQQQAYQDATQGRTNSKKSRHFNTTETVTNTPHLRWPNEGLFSATAKKRVAYDDFTISEWSAGQLANIYQIQDPVLMKQALLQSIRVFRDTTSLPCQAAHTAYAHLMHEIEQSTLNWKNNMQWSLNGLSSSQIAMANASTVNSQQNIRKTCRYFNEGSCTDDSSHGQYKHICSFCSMVGKQLPHSESKCLSKQRGQ